MDEIENLDECAEVPILADSSIRQQMTRSELDGCDYLSVITRVEFEPGADRQVIHVPICPQMSTIPEVDAYSVGGANVRVRLTQIQKFGIRAELVLSESETPLETVVEMVIRSKKILPLSRGAA